MCRPVSGVHNESHDEEAVSGVVPAVCGCCPQSALLPETLPGPAHIPVEGTVDCTYHITQVHTCQRKPFSQEDEHIPSLSSGTCKG